MTRGEFWWHEYYLGLAEYVSTASKDPSTKCGAVIVRPDKTLASVGFNGFPKGCSDDESLYRDRERKLSRVIHAEQNALLLAGESVRGYTMYTYPPGFGPSCDRCTAHIIQAGITRVVHYKDTSNFASRWKGPAKAGLQMYNEAGVEVISICKPEFDSVTQVLSLPALDEEVREHRISI